MERVEPQRLPEMLVRASVAALAFVALCACLPATIEQEEMTLAVPAGVRVLDPALSTDRYSRQVMNLLYTRPVSIDPETGGVVGELALDWETSEDGLEWVFRFHEGRAFSSGRQITAADVAASLRRIVDPRLGSDLAPLMYTVAGAYEFHTASAPNPHGISAPEKYLLRITLDVPTPELPAVLDRVGHVASVAEDGVTILEDYSGAFHIESEQGRSLVLRRTSNEERAPPWLSDRLRILRAPSPARALVEFAAADMLLIDSQDINERPSGSVLIDATPIPVVHHLQLNAATPPTDEITVRRALASSIAPISIENALPFGVVPIVGIAAPGVAAAPRGSSPRGNEPLARLQLATAAQRPPIVVGYNEGAKNARVVQAVAELWETSLGVDSVVQAYPRGEYFDAINDLNVFRVGHSSRIRDARPVFEDLFHSRLGVNWVNHNESRIDAAIDAAALGGEHISRRRQYLEAADLILHERALAIPLYAEQRLLFRRRSDDDN